MHLHELLYLDYDSLSEVSWLYFAHLKKRSCFSETRKGLHPGFDNLDMLLSPTEARIVKHVNIWRISDRLPAALLHHRTLLFKMDGGERTDLLSPEETEPMETVNNIFCRLSGVMRKTSFFNALSARPSPPSCSGGGNNFISMAPCGGWR